MCEDGIPENFFFVDELHEAKGTGPDIDVGILIGHALDILNGDRNGGTEGKARSDFAVPGRSYGDRWKMDNDGPGNDLPAGPDLSNFGDLG